MYNYILDRLPYHSSFRFVDEISFLDADKVIGHYTLKADAFFYEDHFVGNPVTPGSIITEIMAQIGLVVLGIYLVTPEPANAALTAGPSSATTPSTAAASLSAATPKSAAAAPLFPLLTSVEVSFLKMVLPGQKITVISRKIYFRFDKLKCQVEMQDASGGPIAKGFFSGIIKKNDKLKNTVE